MNNDMERRAFGFEIRSVDTPEGGQPVLRGVAAVFNATSEDLGGFREMIAPGAFREALAASDVRALFNHDPNMVLGRTKSGTLRLQETDAGLEFEVDLPDTTYARDLQECMKRGDINQCSFGFSVASGGDAWETEDNGKTWLRTIRSVGRLFDVSPVTYPAYPETSCAMRSLEAAKSQAAPVVNGHLETQKRRLELAALD